MSNDRERKGLRTVNKKTFRIVAVFLCIIMLFGLTPLAYAGEQSSDLPGGSGEGNVVVQEENSGQTGGGSEGNGTGDENNGSESASGSGGSSDNQEGDPDDPDGSDVTKDDEEEEIDDEELLDDENLFLTMLGDEELLLLSEPGIAGSFGGMDLGDGTAAHNETSLAEAYSFARIFKVDATYTDTGDSSLTKTMVIRLNNGMQMGSAPGMVQNGRNWTWNPASNPLPTALEGVITGGTWTLDPVLTPSGYQPYSGTLTYTLNPTTTHLSVEIGVKLDRAFAANKADGASFTDPVSAEGFEGTAEPLTSIGSVKLGAYSVAYTPLIMQNRGSGDDQPIYEKIGNEWETDTRLHFRSSGGNYGYFLFDQIAYTYKFPKQVGLTEVYIPDVNNNALLPAGVQISPIDTSDPDYDFVTVAISAGALKTSGSNYLRIGFRGTIADTAVPGTAYAMQIPSQSWTMYGGAEAISGNFNNFSRVAIYILKDEDQITWRAVSRAEIPADLAGVTELAPLGAFGAINDNDDITGKRIRIDFSPAAGAIGVQAVRLMAGTGGATDVVAVTTKGRTILVGSASGEWPVVNLYSQLEDEEYIQTIEYSVGVIYAGMQTRANGYNMTSTTTESIMYYGQLLNPAAGSFSPTITALNAAGGMTDPDPMDPNDWQFDNDYTQTITIKAPGATISYSDTSVGGSGSILTAGGVAATLRMTGGMGTYRYGASDVWARKGWVVYVREASGLYVDPATVRAEWTAPGYTGTQTTYWNESDPNHSKFTDNTGATVYKMILPDAVVGVYNSSMAGRTVLTYAAVSARNTAKSGPVAMRDIFTNHALGCEGYTTYSYQGTTRRADIYNFTGNTNNMLQVPLTTAVINVRGNAALNVSTSADKGDDNWQVYYPGNNSTVVNLNTQLDARYRVDISNDSGKDIGSGYVALIPIPKKEESIPVEFRYGSNNTFEWSLYLEEEVVLNATDYTVKYALSYLTSDSDSGWKDWADVEADKDEIRCVMVKYNENALPIDFTDAFHFNIATPTGAEAATAQDKVNIYTASIWANIEGNAAYRPSEPVALKLSTGIVSGTVFTDTDKDGVLDDGTDTPRGGVTVRAYKAGSRDADDLLETVTTDNTTGAYMFTELTAGEVVDLVFVNPGSASDLRFVIPTPEADGLSAVIEGVMPSGGSHTDQNALLQAPYTVTFDTQGGGVVASQKVYGGDKATRPATDPARTGYVFKDWYTTSGGNVPFDFANTTIVSETTIYAQWEVMKITNSASGFVYKDKDGNDSFGGTDVKYAAGSIDVGLYKQNDSNWDLVDQTAVLTDGGYEFTAGSAGGWDGSTGTYRVQAISDSPYVSVPSESFAVTAVANTIVNVTSGVKAQITINAEFKNQNSDVVGDASYEAYGADKGYYYDTTSDVSITAVESGATGHEVANPNRAHYTLKAGTSPQSASGFDFDNTATFTQTVTFELVGNTYTVVFDKNGGDTEASPRTMSVQYPTVNLSSLPVSPKRTGHTFDGWTFDARGNGSFNTSYDISAGVNPATGILTVYASWSANNYNLLFNLNGGEGSAPNTQVLKYGSLATPVSNPARGSHTFQGWNTAADGSGNGWNFATTTMPANNVTLYAQWQYNGGGGGGETTTPPPPPTVNPPVVTPENPDPTPTQTTDPTPTPTQTSDPAPVVEPGTETELEPDGNPGALSGFQIGEDGVPLFGGAAVWALLNFIMMLIGGVLAVFLLIRSAIKNRRNEEEDQAYEDGVAHYGDEEEGEQKRTRPVWRILSIVLGIVGVIVFLLTEDMTNMMVWLDQWTILMGLILIAELVAARLSFKKPKEEEEPEAQNV